MDYIKIFFMSMIPVVELRGAAIYSQFLGLPVVPSFVVCILGNALPVPFIYFYARKLLIWAEDKPVIGKVAHFLHDKGERAGAALTKKAGRWGSFFAMVLFVGIPIPGTGAWTGTLAASILDMGIKHTAASVFLGLILAGTIMITAGFLGFNLI